uniref:Methyltransferase FkbM domain-containing protein n=1 Tax=viral metagenome TaxID=1070528 RepID=A0A6C0LN08_9ZZZZ
MFFDIGANVGLWAEANIHATDKIIAVEASPITFMKLVNNVKNSNIVCINFAACNNDGKDITFYQGDADTLSTVNEDWFLDPESRFHNHPHFPIICKTITLDALIAEFGIPDLIKIDVEAGEYECISSLTQKVNLLCFEWASEVNAITFKCLDYLLTIGFTEFYLQNGDAYTFRPKSEDFYSIDTVKLHLMNSVIRLDMGMVWCR